MTAFVQEIRQIDVFPYLATVPLEADPVASADTGRYQSRAFAGQIRHILDLDTVRGARGLHVGGAYFCTARDADGRRMRTHWLFCTRIGPGATFGISGQPGRPDGFCPILPGIDDPILRLEELADIVVVFRPAAETGAPSEGQIGRSGWLVATRIGPPHRIGILVEDPVLPTSLCPGAFGIVLAARSVRTTQSVSLDGLSCIGTEDGAMFLQMDGWR